MTCCHCQGADKLFNARTARKELKRYRKKGPTASTALLLSSIEAQGIAGATLLDIGGGIGALQHELASRELGAVVSVDASRGYLDTARSVAQERGYADRATYLEGDFLDVAADVPEVDIVTLDRVVCCYPDMPALVAASAGKARRLYALVFPRWTWWIRLGFTVLNGVLRYVLRSPFRTFARPFERIDETVKAQGFERISRERTLIWEAVVYGRLQTPARSI